jgi:hypothetical protein
VSRHARALPAWTITAACAVAYVIAAPPSSDLAAAGYRSDLFARAGLTLWDNGWYAGHHLLGYSLLAPGLGALLGLQLLAGLSMTAAAALFEQLIDGRAADRATRMASLWFALGAAVSLLANRVAFDLGLALGLAALLVAAPHPGALRRAARHGPAAAALALTLAALSALGSPVAGAFLALATLAWALVSRPARRLALAMTLAALAPIALLAIAFPEGGSQPFVASAFYPTLALTLLVAVAIPPSERALRAGALLYALALVGAYVVATPVGGNADRLGALVAGPLLAYALRGRVLPRAPDTALGSARPGAGYRRRWAPGGSPRAWAVLGLAVLLAYWQVKAPISDSISAASDPAVNESYYKPLLSELRRLDIGYGARPARIEVVPTRDHGEARWVADRVTIARGWERQLELAHDGLFYDGSREPSAARYRAWLGEQAVSYVAIDDAPLDYSARGEARVIDRSPSYLREVWHAEHWRLFAVLGATPLVARPSVMMRLDSDAFTLHASAPGTSLVRVRFTPYWALVRGHGCVSRAPGGWTQVRARAAGELGVAIDFSPARVFSHGARCR